MKEFLQSAKKASKVVATLNSATKNTVLNQMADALVSNFETIMAKNKQDITWAKENNLSSAMLDRLILDEKRITAMAVSLREISALREPVGMVLDGWMSEKGLRIEKVSVPIGVVAIIYESRPNVTSDTAALCFKSGNVCILKGGKEAQNSNEAIANIMQDVLIANGLPKEMISLIPDGSREGVAKLIREDKYIDLVIPRGGNALIRFVSENATMPVVKHDKGLCHTYIDKDADFDKAIKIAINAKCDRPSVCNAMETLLVDKAIAKEILPRLKLAFEAYHTQLLGDELTRQIIETSPASDEDWDTEYEANILSIKIVDGVDEAMEHIFIHGSQHSDAIITENYTTANKFLDGVDSAAVYVNASTRFTDGGEFGFGAEVGISTSKLHARGPMGINDLTTYKYKIFGDGHVR